MPLKLYVFPPSPRSFKVLALASFLSLEHETCVVDLGKGEQRRPDHAGINPNRKVPVLEENGFRLWEANAILQYLAGKRPDRGLLPQDPARRALAAQWQFWDLAHWEPALVPVLLERCIKPLLGLGEPVAAEIERGLEGFARVAPVLDDQLGSSRFVAGPDLTVADFSIGAILNLSEMAGLPVDEYPNIRRWHGELGALPGWRQAMVSPPCNPPP
jgi:glutathione S-transferase